ncbi:MAG: strawberry notch C-terminal domain-containing protein [Sphingomonadales bacterium]|nr:strawberry notch C-terminal domain-containing protein [Sphingomonadales bacterium]
MRDLGAGEPAARHHLLLEAGWKADTRDPGSRVHKPHQSGTQPPLFRPVATDVPSEKRFLSTIARRLDTLGAITRGQRQTGGQGLFRPEDNLESPYALRALSQFCLLIDADEVKRCSLATFEAMTGLSLTDGSGCLRDELPPITTFLNRLLALTISMQNVLFTVFEQLLSAKVESAIAAETRAMSGWKLWLRTASRRHQHGVRSRSTSTRHRGRDPAAHHRHARAQPAGDARPGARLGRRAGGAAADQRPLEKRAAVQFPARSVMLDDGEVERRVRLVRPMERLNFALSHLAETSVEA